MSRKTNWPTHSTANRCHCMSIATWVVEWRMDSSNREVGVGIRS